MKPSTILLALALVLGGLVAFLLFDDSPEPGPRTGGLLPGGGSALASDAGAPRGSADLDVDDEGQPAGAERSEVIDEAKAKAARDEAKAAAARAAGPFLVGRVFDDRGFPVPNAAVKLSASGPAGMALTFGPTGFLENTTTDANGAYKAPRDGFFGDSLRVRVRARGYLAFDEEIDVDPVSGDRQVPAVDLEVGVVLAGVVQDAEGRPVEGAEVVRTTLERENGYRGPRMFRRGGDGGSGKIVTDAEGRFELGNEPVGDFVVLVDHESYPQGRLEGSAPFPGFEDNGLVIELDPTASIAGRIEGFPRGRKFVNVHAVPTELAKGEELTGPEAIFAAAGMGDENRAEVYADGSFLLEGLEPGRAYDLVAKTQGGMMQLSSCSDRAEAMAGTMDVVLTWDAGASVVFDLVDADTGKAINGSSVRYLWEKDDRSFMDFGSKRRDFTTGRIELGELRPSPSPGSLSMAVSAEGYLDLFREEVQVEEDAVVDLGKVSLVRAPVFEVLVLDAGDDDPLSRARLVLTPDAEGGEERSRWQDFGIESTAPKSSKGRTERDGVCALSVTAARTATLKVTRSGYADQVIEGLAMPSRGRAEYTVRMVEGGVLEVQVVDTKGEPVAKARVEHRAPSGAEGAGVTSRKGKIKLKDLEVGEYDLRASRPDGGGAMIAFGGELAGDEEEPWTHITVASGDELPVTLRVPVQTNLSGALTIDGAPLAGAEVDLYRGAAPEAEADEAARFSRRMRAWGGEESARTDKQGRFVLEELDIGPHHLRITVAEGQPDHIVSVDLREGENTMTADLPTGRVRGQVTDSSGKPIPGARVSIGVSSSGNGTSFWGDQDEDGVLTDDDGRFVIEQLPLGEEFKARASASGFVSARSEAFSVTAAAPEAETAIQLATGASIRVILLGDPSNFERLQAERQGEDGNTLDRKSRFVRGSEVVLQDLTPGSWTVWLTSGWGNDEGKGAVYSVEVLAGTEARVTIQR